jgi:hypothetical protein
MSVLSGPERQLQRSKSAQADIGFSAMATMGEEFADFRVI